MLIIKIAENKLFYFESIITTTVPYFIHQGILRLLPIKILKKYQFHNGHDKFYLLSIIIN